MLYALLRMNHISLLLPHSSKLQSKRYFIRKFLNCVKEKSNEHRDNFQNWAEFENRGFIRPELMRAWIIEDYGSPEKVLQLETVNTPSNKFKSHVDARESYLWQAVRYPNDVLVKVHAASVNPIDLRICEGFGKNLFNFQRHMLYERINAALAFVGVGQSQFPHSEFPIILGRDFSGTVVDIGTGVFDIKVGDEVFGAPNLFHSGTLSDYVCVNLAEVVQRPATLSHIEAASIPYVGLTVASALRSLVTNPTTPKHALVLGGSGGVGTFAIQYLQAYGYTVTTTCSTIGVPICNKLGAHCIDYTKEDVDKVLMEEKYSIVFDPIAAASPGWANRCLIKNGTYISLRSPLLEMTNRYGLLLGSSSTYLIYVKNKFQNSNINVHWSFFKPDRQALLEIARIIDADLIKPVVFPDNIFSFEDAPKALKVLSEGHTKGKIVVNISGLPESVLKPSAEKVIHL